MTERISTELGKYEGGRKKGEIGDKEEGMGREGKGVWMIEGLDGLWGWGIGGMGFGYFFGGGI